MTLQKWNGEWEKPDPLRGKRGWGRRRYIAAGVTAMLFVTPCGLIVTAMVKLRLKAVEKDISNELRRDAFDKMARDSRRN